MFTCRSHHNTPSVQAHAWNIRSRCESSAVFLLTGLFLATAFSTRSSASESTLSEQLLQSYFDTAGVCSSSSIESITESEDRLSVIIGIPKAEANALINVSDDLKDDWFSLHCPPEIHGVWHQPQPPEDVLVSGVLKDTRQYTLSCRDYLGLEKDQPDPSLRQQIARTIEQLFEQ